MFSNRPDRVLGWNDSQFPGSSHGHLAALEAHCVLSCEKKFSTKQVLRVHERTHTGEKPFECKYCSQIFTQSQAVKVHERIHTGENSFVCKFSAKGFIQ